jgi:hypothetical protein
MSHSETQQERLGGLSNVRSLRIDKFGVEFFRVPEDHDGHCADDSKRIRSQDRRDEMIKNLFAAIQTTAFGKDVTVKSFWQRQVWADAE